MKVRRRRLNSPRDNLSLRRFLEHLFVLCAFAFFADLPAEAMPFVVCGFSLLGATKSVRCAIYTRPPSMIGLVATLAPTIGPTVGGY